MATKTVIRTAISTAIRTAIHTATQKVTKTIIGSKLSRRIGVALAAVILLTGQTVPHVRAEQGGEGTTAETAYPVYPGKLQHGQLQAGEWQFYSLVAEKGTKVKFEINGARGSDDELTVIISHNNQTVRSASSNAGMRFEFMAAETGTYKVSLFTDVRYDYVLRADYTPGILITINGQPFHTAQSAVMMQGVTRVPMRAIFEALGASVQWDPRGKTIRASKDGTSVQLTLGSSVSYINGTKTTMNASAVLIGAAAMVPLRFVSEALHAACSWDERSREIAISY